MKWTEVEMLTMSPKLDGVVESVIFGRKILGWEKSIFTFEGGWDVKPKDRSNSWMCRAEMRPVYFNGACRCRWSDREDRKYNAKVKKKLSGKDRRELKLTKRPRFKGHIAMCLNPAENYCEELAKALNLFHQMKNPPESHWLEWKHGTWIAAVAAKGKFTVALQQGAQHDEGPAATALVKAIVKYALGGSV
jgi:hypothetical protein